MGWSCLCEVDTTLLFCWLATSRGWPVQRTGQPQRLPAPDVAEPVIAKVLELFPGATYRKGYACLSRVTPGQGHGYHQDSQGPDWITRVHVPITTNPDCWFMFADNDGVKVHFEVGKAYSFDTLKPHAFGNDGGSGRVHLIFDVVKCGNAY